MRLFFSGIFLCLFATSNASAVTITVPYPYDYTAEFRVIGAIDDLAIFNVSVASGPHVSGPDTTFDPQNYSETHFTIGFNGGVYEQSECSEADFHCGRYDRRDPGFILENDPTIRVAVGFFGSGPYAVFSPIVFNINLPNDLRLIDANVTAVPEASTWAMLLIGFAGIGILARRRLGPAAKTS